MQQVLKVSTAATTIVGPILDSTGAAYTGAVIGDLNLTKNGTTAAMAATATLTHDHNGHYILVFTTGNTDTLGRLDVTCNKATYAMPPKCFEVLSATTFDALVTNGTLASTTSGRTIVTDAAGLVDANTVKLGPTGAGTAQTARDIGASVLLSTGTGTGQLDFTSGVVKANVAQWLGTAASTPTVAGVPNVNVKTWNDLATVALPLVPTVAGRTLDVSAGGEAGLDWANIGGQSTTVGLSATTISNVTNVAAASLASNESSVIRSNTAQGGSTAAVQLDSSASATDNFYNGTTVTIYAGTGIGQTRTITAYVGSTKTATVDRAFVTAPDSSSSFAIKDRDNPKLNSSLEVVSASVTGSVGSISGVTFPTNFSVLSISATTGLVDITQTAADKAWSTATRVLTAGTNIVLAKGTGVTGFNDLAAAGVSAAVWDAATATYGAAGSYGLLVETNLDAAVSSRMATFTYTAPPTAAANATAVWQDLLAGSDFGTASSIGKLIKDNVNAPLSGLAPASTALSSDTWTNAKAAFLDAAISSRMATFALPTNFALMLIDADGRPIVDAHKLHWIIAGTTESVYRADGTTLSYTKTLTTDAAALPITGN